EACLFERAFRARVDGEHVREQTVQTHCVERQIGEQPDRLAAVAAAASVLVAEEDSHFGFAIGGVDVPEPDIADMTTAVDCLDAEIPAIASVLQPLKPSLMFIRIDTCGAAEQPHHGRVVDPVQCRAEMAFGKWDELNMDSAHQNPRRDYRDRLLTSKAAQ